MSKNTLSFLDFFVRNKEQEKFTHNVAANKYTSYESHEYDQSITSSPQSNFILL